MTTPKYIGGELLLFAEAHHWKAYYAERLRPYIRGDVLEVGAGLGGTTRALWNEHVRNWTCLEPDAELAGLALQRFRDEKAPVLPKVVAGDLAALAEGRKFDTIVYIDVLEHIEDDRGELLRAAAHLGPGGMLVVLSPAFNFLFSPFDAQIGHFRRYDRRQLQRAAPPSLRCVKMEYLDSVGMLLSMGNRVLLRASQPTESQVRFWDRRVIPLSRCIDSLTRWRIGKTVVGIWTNEAASVGQTPTPAAPVAVFP